MRVQVKGEVRLQQKEVSDYKWWDGKEPIPMLPSAEAILKRATSPSPNPAGPGRPLSKAQTINMNGHVSGF